MEAQDPNQPTNAPKTTGTTSEKESGNIWRDEVMRLTEQMLNCFPNTPDVDPKIWFTSIVGILLEYSEEIVCQVTDPLHGLASKQQFMPQPFHVRQACELLASMPSRRALPKTKPWGSGDKPGHLRNAQVTVCSAAELRALRKENPMWYRWWHEDNFAQGPQKYVDWLDKYPEFLPQGIVVRYYTPVDPSIIEACTKRKIMLQYRPKQTQEQMENEMAERGVYMQDWQRRNKYKIDAKLRAEMVDRYGDVYRAIPDAPRRPVHPEAGRIVTWEEAQELRRQYGVTAGGALGGQKKPSKAASDLPDWLTT
jgi:hypothetical protein